MFVDPGLWRASTAKLALMFSLDDVAKHAVDFRLSTEDLPRPDNRVTVERDGNVTLSYMPKQKLYDQLRCPG